MQKRLFILLCVTLLAGGTLSAQEHNLLDYGRELLGVLTEMLEPSSKPDSAECKTIINHSAQMAIDKYNQQTTPNESYQGYRIRIFASHNQTARTDAEAAIALLNEHYNISHYLTYENPYFLVTCGDCLTQEEAIMLLSKVKIHFPKAFIVTTEIPASTFTTPPAPPAEEPTEEENEEELKIENGELKIEE